MTLLLSFILGCVGLCLLLFSIIVYHLFVGNYVNKPVNNPVDSFLGKSVDNCVDKLSANTHYHDIMTMNIANYEDRLLELQQDMDNGHIKRPVYVYQKRQLQEQLQQAKYQLQSQLKTGSGSIEVNNTNIKITVALCLCIGIVSSVLYFISTGTSRVALLNYWQNADKIVPIADDLLMGKIQTPPDWIATDLQNRQYLITALQENVHTNITDEHHAALRWFRLANFYSNIGATDSALSAMVRAYHFQPDNQAIALGYIRLGFLANGQILTVANKQRLQAFLSEHPNNQKAMMLMAMGETTANNYNQALIWVDKLKSVIMQQTNEQIGQDAISQMRANEVNQTLINLQQLRLVIVEKQKALTESLPINND